MSVEKKIENRGWWNMRLMMEHESHDGYLKVGFHCKILTLSYWNLRISTWGEKEVEKRRKWIQLSYYPMCGERWFLHKMQSSVQPWMVSLEILEYSEWECNWRNRRYSHPQCFISKYYAKLCNSHTIVDWSISSLEVSLGVLAQPTWLTKQE